MFLGGISPIVIDVIYVSVCVRLSRSCIVPKRQKISINTISFAYDSPVSLRDHVKI